MINWSVLQQTSPYKTDSYMNTVKVNRRRVSKRPQFHSYVQHVIIQSVIPILKKVVAMRYFRIDISTPESFLSCLTLSVALGEI